MQAPYTRLFSDEHGESRVEDVSVVMQVLFKVEGTDPLFRGPLQPSDGFCFGGAPRGWIGDAPHPAPRRFLAVIVRGQLEVTTSSGEIQRFGPGNVYLVEDITGVGHSSRIIGDEEVISMGCCSLRMSLEMLEFRALPAARLVGSGLAWNDTRQVRPFVELGDRHRDAYFGHGQLVAAG